MALAGGFVVLQASDRRDIARGQLRDIESNYQTTTLRKGVAQANTALSAEEKAALVASLDKQLTGLEAEHAAFKTAAGL